MERLRKISAIDGLIDKFEELKLRLENTKNPNEKQIIIQEMKNTALDIPTLRGWPKDRVFWSEDAFLWKTLRVEKGIREFIKKSLKEKIEKNNLEIGCGSFSYFPGVDLDFSFRMLKENESKNSKALGDAMSLPFKAESFDSVSMVFVCNYLSDLEKVFLEIKKILKKGGKLLIVQSVVDVASMHSIVQKHPAKGFEKELEETLEKTGFKVKISKTDFEKKSFWLIQASV